MREYLRQEKISIRYMPLFLLTRTLFLVLMIWIPAVQLFIMIWAHNFSYGFRYETEAEYLLPLSDDELRRMRLERGHMIWLRYLIVGLISSALAFLLPEGFLLRGELFTRPLVYVAYFVLQMTAIYEGLLEKITNQARDAHRTVFQFIFCTIPTILLFTYAFSSMSFHHFMPVFMEGAEWIHILLLLAATAFMAVYCMKLYRDWKLTDYRQSIIRPTKQKGNGGK